MIFILMFVEIFCIMMLFMIFQYGSEPTDINRFRSHTGKRITAIGLNRSFC